MVSFATAFSVALQHGVPLKLLCDKFAHTRFEPSGFTGNQQIPIAKSIMDYIFRWLELRFVSGQQYTLFENLRQPVAPAAASEDRVAQPPSAIGENDTSAPKGALAPEVASNQQLAAGSYDPGP